MKTRGRWLAMLLVITSCARGPSAGGPDMSSEILSEINRIPAIDNHAHPVRFAAEGTPDREFDALPVDNMEPWSDPVKLRPNDPDILRAWQTLWNYPYNDSDAAHMREWKEHKQRLGQQKGAAYPEWVLDKAGIERMLTNRVHMGASIEPPRFRWVPYVDALLFPLDNSLLAARNSDRKAFFADEDSLRQQYLMDSGL